MATATPTSTIPQAAASSTSGSRAASCTTAIPGQYGYVPWDACNANYDYDPQYAPAVAVAVLFGLLTAAHVAEGILFQKRYTWVVTMGAFWEMLAFVIGALGAHDQQNGGYAFAHTILFLLAPLWINAFAYMTLSRMVHFFIPDKHIAGIRSTVLSKIFVTGDIITFLVQAIGGLMTTPRADPTTAQNGLHIYMAGIGLQQGCIVAFLGLMTVFHRKALAFENWTTNEHGGTVMRSWKGTLYGLYAVLAVITMRIVYRLCEYAGGVLPSNPLPFHEAYSYALDAAPMMTALLILAIWHPGRVLQGPDSDFTQHRAEKKAAKRAKKAAKRSAHEDGIVLGKDATFESAASF